MAVCVHVLVREGFLGLHLLLVGVLLGGWNAFLTRQRLMKDHGSDCCWGPALRKTQALPANDTRSL